MAQEEAAVQYKPLGVPAGSSPVKNLSSQLTHWELTLKLTDTQVACGELPISFNVILQ